jgi:hypothetical protein
MCYRVRVATLAILAVFSIGVSSAAATPILGAVSVTASSVDPFGRDPANLINQSGLSAGYTSGVTDFDTYVQTTTVSNGVDSEIGGAGAPPASFTFDLGSPSSIDAIAIWNEFGSGALNTFTVQTSLLADFSVAQTFGVFTMSVFAGANNLAADVFDFTSQSAEFVRINALTNAGFPGATLLNEVAFRSSGPGPAPVPEPASLMLLGTGVLTLVGRRVRQGRP